MMNMMTMFANRYAEAMNQTAEWTMAHPVFTFVSWTAMAGLALWTGVLFIKSIKNL